MIMIVSFIENQQFRNTMLTVDLRITSFTLIILAFGTCATLDTPNLHEEPSFRILAVFHNWHTPSQVIGMRLVQELVAKRHKVTVISPFKSRSLTNYRHIYIDGMTMHLPRHGKIYKTIENSASLEFFPIF